MRRVSQRPSVIFESFVAGLSRCRIDLLSSVGAECKKRLSIRFLFHISRPTTGLTTHQRLYLLHLYNVARSKLAPSVFLLLSTSGNLLGRFFSRILFCSSSSIMISYLAFVLCICCDRFVIGVVHSMTLEFSFSLD